MKARRDGKPLCVADMVRLMELKGIEVERRAIYRYIHAMEEYGYRFKRSYVGRRKYYMMQS